MKPLIENWYIQELGYLDDINKINSCFHLRLELEIAFGSLKGVDDYSIDICDKEGLKKEVERIFESDFEKSNNIKSCYLYKTLVLKEFDKEEIKRLINEFVNQCDGDNWYEINFKLKEKLEYNP